MDSVFTVGITPDFDRHAKGLIDPTLAERFDGVPGLTTPGSRTSALRRRRRSSGTWTP